MFSSAQVLAGLPLLFFGRRVGVVGVGAGDHDVFVGDDVPGGCGVAGVGISADFVAGAGVLAGPCCCWWFALL